MKSFFISLVICTAVLSSKAYSQTRAIKTNVLYGISTFTPNLGAEIQVSRQWSIGLAGSYHPWTFSGNRKLKHWLIQPEARYWFREAFMGHFITLHGLSGEYNIGGIKLPGNMGRELRNHRYEGWVAGAGIGYGYNRHLGKRWSLELEAGLGYLHLDYKKSQNKPCGMQLEQRNRAYFGPTKLAVNLVYRLGRKDKDMAFHHRTFKIDKDLS